MMVFIREISSFLFWLFLPFAAVIGTCWLIVFIKKVRVVLRKKELSNQEKLIAISLLPSRLWKSYVYWLKKTKVARRIFMKNHMRESWESRKWGLYICLLIFVMIVIGSTCDHFFNKK